MGIIYFMVMMSCSDQQESESSKELAKERTEVASIEEGNVLFIIMDTLRADRMGVYGYDIDLTPNLDKLAREGVRFENHISNCSWTRPSMGAIFTGHYPRTLGLYEERFDVLPSEFDTMAERFKAKGFNTYGITSNPNTNEMFGFGEGYDVYGDSGKVFKWMDKESKQKSDSDYQLENATSITDRAFELIKHNKLSESTTPFFLSLVYIDPHKPYRAPQKYFEFAKKHTSTTQGYDAGVRYADEEIGRLLQGMKDLGLLDNTTIFFTSDHGEGLKSHPKIPDSSGHGTTLYDSNVHVPLFVHHPSLKSNVISKINASIDLMPTLIELFELKPDEKLPGTSLAPLILGTGAVNLPEVVFMETEMEKNDKIGIRTATHSYIINDDVKMYREKGIYEGHGLKDYEEAMLNEFPVEEMYNRSDKKMTEVYTNNNIISSDSKTAEKLKAMIQEWENATGYQEPKNRSPKDVLTLKNGEKVFPYKSSGGSDDIDEKTRNALEQLGYLDPE
jgi:arylsulfatase A-like enzyme